MPTYEYKCVNCGHIFERFQKMTDQPVEDCPACGGHVRRLMGGGAGFIFKGSGFYITDYKMKNSNSEKDSGVKRKDLDNKKKVKKETDNVK